MKRTVPLLLLLAVGLLVFAVPSLPQSAHSAAAPEVRQEGAGHEAEAGHGSSWVEVIGKWANFIVLAAILYLFLTKTINVPDRFRKDYQEIQMSIEKARSAREEAEVRLKELDARMENMAGEISEIKEQAAREAEEEKKRILEAARKEAERIVQMAHRDIETEVEQAKKSLRRQVADLAVEKGRNILQKEINEEDQKRLIENYIQEFGK
jgi:F-type H+-transporting ATPase subunit b